MGSSVPRGFVCLLGLLLVVSGCGVIENPTEMAVHEQLMIVSPQESQAGPQPVAVSLEDGAMDSTVEDSARIDAEAARRMEVLGHKDTTHVLVGRVIAKKAFLFDTSSVEGAETDGPRFRILTRVTFEVQSSYREVPHDANIEFWHQCGMLDQEDWAEGKPMGCELDIGVAFELEDRILVALHGRGSLPDGSSAYMLRGNRRGATFLDSRDESERAVAETVLSYFDGGRNLP
ncbi:MAG TPA: hypothetical protein PK668_08695 [Myxococcota bacterium]|nr:hypothetical protein [Myxococcota bacterium]HRY92944.1 hypothetical protein [Myxococcota bacterium]HSA21263.1 hypothetical protein [Myxococcota bacterium]